MKEEQSVGINITIFKESPNYIAAVRPFLESREEENGLYLGNLAMHETDSSLKASFMAQIRRGSKTVFAAYYRERNLVVSRGPEDAVLLIAERLLELKIDIPGVIGPAQESELLASEWARVRGCSSFLAMDQLLYKLIEINWPSGVPGQMRPVESRDADLLEKWIHAFHVEALPHEPFSLERNRENVQKRILAGMTFLWEMDGKPVAMAALARPSVRGITVNAVFTPEGQRKQGYATAIVAAVSAEGLRRGKDFCTLYTDLMNPTSNSIYQKIGYKVVCGSRNYRFRYL